MARRLQSSFSSGELDPALHERTNLDKYNSALGTGRNVIVGKTGRLISRHGTLYAGKPKYGDKKSVTYPIHYKGLVLEFGDEYVRVLIYQENGQIVLGQEVVSPFTEDDIDDLHFTVNSKGEVFIACEGKDSQIFTIDPGFTYNEFVAEQLRIYQQQWAANFGGSAYSATGYVVDYAVSFIDQYNQESEIEELIDPNFKLPITVGESNKLKVQGMPGIGWRELRVYRRPHNGGEYGYIGSSFEVIESPPGTYYFEFTDQGQTADYSHIPPSYIYDFENDMYISATPSTPPILLARPRTAIYYQNRLIMSGSKDEEAIHASRVGASRSFTRDYPYNAASSLTFKTATDGNGKVLRFLDAGPLVAFTTQGVYANDPGPLTAANIAMIKKGDWIIQDDLPPLVLPGAVLFFDDLTRAVIAINYSTESTSFQGEDVSVFSDHLFRNKRIKSWCFANGEIPVVIAVMDDGTISLFTYQKEQLMRAWTRQDTLNGFYTQVTAYKGFNKESSVLFTVIRNGERIYETRTTRQLTELRDFVGVDSSVTQRRPVQYGGGGGFPIDNLGNLTPVVGSDWGGELLVNFPDHPNVDDPIVGDLLRVFYDDQSMIDLEVTEVVDDQNFKVQPIGIYRSAEASQRTFFYTFDTVDGLDHLEGQYVSILADGYIKASPLNDQEDYPNVLVAGGAITLPEDYRGAVVTVGVPIVNDVETLDVTTVEQKPTILESIICAMVYIKLFMSRSIWVGQKFPEGNGLEGLERTETRQLTDIINNQPQLPYTRREEIVIQGNYQSQGRIACRNVDPYPVEFLSIIPDLDVTRKG